MKLHLVFATAFILLAAQPSIAADKIKPVPVPNFTQGDVLPKDAPHDWTLGPTGARGWIYTTNGHSRFARQILVTSVAKGSPSASKLNVGDVILGVNGIPFSDDARILFAKAVALAESENGGGKLKLLRWRNGATETVELSLQVLGSYSATAPYDCQKSAQIFQLGCISLAKRMSDANYARKLNPIPRALNAMALLASGNKEYLPLVQTEAQWAADFSSDGFATWYYGYLLTFLAEYVHATGDLSVMPGLKRLAMESARGQSGVGTWGHKFARPDGNLSGYGCMNQPGLSLCIGMALAREAGVKEPELDQAIAKAARFLRWYVNKGALPYGDHLPFPAHEDNGKCSSAAVLFDLLGDREAAEFFTKMSTAAYSERERGHTGNFFNVLWALPGVSRGGPNAAGAYMNEQAWYYDLARDWETNFLYQGSPVGEEEHGKYAGWDCTGGYLLGYALPRKSLLCTGKKPCTVPMMDATRVAEVIAAGRDFAYKGEPNRYDERTIDQLMTGLTSWSPFVRKRSAASLSNKEGDFVPALLKYLASDNQNSRYGACEALGALGPRADAAAPQLREALKDGDPWVQCLAAEAIPNLSPEIRKECVSDLLIATSRKNPADPRCLVARSASVALFSPYPGRREPRSILGESLEGVDRQQLIPAIQSLLQHEDSVARSSVRKVYNQLTDQDLIQLLPDITKAIERIAPSNEMFADGIRLAGLDLLSRLHIREGMALCVSVIEPDRWGEKNRTKDCLRYLQRYGSHAQSLLPRLKEIRETIATEKKGAVESLKHLDEAISAIGSSTTTPTLVDIAEFRIRNSN